MKAHSLICLLRRVLTIAVPLALLAAPAEPIAAGSPTGTAPFSAASRVHLPFVINQFRATYTYRIGVRVVNGTGEFYDRRTGLRFVPRGNNIIRLGPQGTPSGEIIFYHTTFDPLVYDPVRAEAAFQRMQADGYNLVRVFLSHNTIVKGREFDPAYFANIVDFLRKAKVHGIYVMTTLDGAPGQKYGSIWDDCCAQFDGSNLNFLSPSGLRGNTAYYVDFMRELAAAGAPLDAIFAYELRNELFFETNYPPLSLTSGKVRTANGKTYDMAIPADKQRMIDETLPYWIDSARAAIRAVDPTALVTVGFFQPQEPNPTRIGDTRLSSTHTAIWQSHADFIDLHLYPGLELTLPQYLENYGVEGMKAKPILMGEFGAFSDVYASVSAAAQALQDWQVESCAHGFDGWLLWTWDTDEQRELWNALSQDDVINAALAPRTHPDPCAGSPFPGQNVALHKPATASRWLPSNPPSMAVDGITTNWWGSGDFAPQWLEINLQSAYRVAAIRMVVNQWPVGHTVHRLLGRSATGSYRLLRELSGTTSGGQVLEYAPPSPWTDIQYVRVETTTSPSWVSWSEVEVIAAGE